MFGQRIELQQVSNDLTALDDGKGVQFQFDETLTHRVAAFGDQLPALLVAIRTNNQAKEQRCRGGQWQQLA